MTHPLLIPYNYLNDFEKSKDNLVNFLVIEFDNFIKNKTKNCFELFFNYKMTNSDGTLFLKSNKCLLKDCLEDLNSGFNNSNSNSIYKILAINNNKLEKMLNVKRCK